MSRPNVTSVVIVLIALFFCWLFFFSGLDEAFADMFGGPMAPERRVRMRVWFAASLVVGLPANLLVMVWLINFVRTCRVENPKAWGCVGILVLMLLMTGTLMLPIFYSALGLLHWDNQ